MRPSLLRLLLGISLLLFSTLSMAADDPLSYAARNDGTMLVSYFPIILQGETAGAEHMFQFISGIAQETMGGRLGAILYLVMGIALIGIVYRFGKQGDEIIGQGAKEIAFTVVMAVALFSPSVSVTLYDGRDGTGTDLRVVDGVPWFVAATASFATSINTNVLNIVDEASAVIGNNADIMFGSQTLGSPELFALKAIQQIKMDANVSAAITAVTKECLIANSVDNTIFEHLNKYKTTDGTYSSFEAMEKLGEYEFMKQTTMKNGMSCTDFINANLGAATKARLDTDITNTINNLTFFEQEKLAAIAAQYLGMTDNTTDGYSQTLSNFIGYMKNYQFNGIVAGALVDARAEALGGGDSIAVTAGAVSAASIGNIQTSGIGTWRATTEMLPLAYQHLIVIIWGASILMGYIVLASGYDKGMMILKEYFIGLLTFGTVPIAFALENNHILFYAQENALGLLSGEYQNPAAMPVIGPHLDYLASMAGMAGAQGLGAAMIVPGIIYGGRVAMAMGMFSGLGGMVNNKTPQGVVEDAGAERARQTAIANHSMRSELEKAGIHIGANGDVGAVYSQYQASLDKASTQFADAGTYKDHAKRFAATEAQQFGSNSAMIGAGGEAQKTGLDRVSASRRASGAADFTGQIAQGEGLMDAGGYDSSKGVSEAYKKGQYASALKTAGATTGAGKEFDKHGASDILASAEAEASEAMATSVAKMKTNKEKGLVGADNTMSDAGRMAISLEAGKAVDQRIGNMAGIYNNMHDKKGEFAGAYQTNAATSEMAQTRSSYATTMAQGGVNKAVETAVAGAHLGAAEGQAALENKLKSLGGKGTDLEKMADAVEGAARRVAGATSRKQTQESLGAADGIEHEEKKHKNDKSNPFRSVAQSGVESQVESGLGAIRGAGSIHSLASQAGIKAQSDSTALAATIKTAGGAGDFIAMNKTLAVGNTMGQLAEIDEARDQFGSFGAYKTTSARGAVSMAKAVFDGEKASDFRNEDGSYSEKGMIAVASQKSKDSGTSMSGAESLGLEGAKAENKMLKAQSNHDDKSLIAMGLAKEDKNGNVVETTGLERAAAKGWAMGGDQFGMRGGTFVDKDGNVQKVSMATIMHGGEAKANINSVAIGTKFDTNAQGKLEDNVVSAGISQMAAFVASAPGMITAASAGGREAAGELGYNKETGEYAGMALAGGFATYFGNKAVGNPIGKMFKRGDKKSESSDSKNPSGDKPVDVASGVSQDSHDADTNNNPNNDTHNKSPNSNIHNYTGMEKPTQGVIEKALGWGGKALNAVGSMASHGMQVAKAVAPALIDGTAFSPTSLGEGSDVLPQRGAVNHNVTAMQQAYAQANQTYAQQAQYAQDTRYSGTYQHIQAAMANHPEYASMASNAAMTIGTPSQSGSIGDTMRVQADQSLQMRHNSQVQADHMREASRSMSEMVNQMSDLSAFFEGLMGAKEGKVKSDA